MVKVLDVCCGSRMMWIDKHHPDALYVDKRYGKKKMDIGTPSTKGRSDCVVSPDLIADFRNLPFPDNSFYHVVFDPPHIEKKMGKIETGILPFKYGVLSEDWRDDIAKGFSECLRVLKPNGTLIFKWCEVEIKLSEVLGLVSCAPLYGHRSGKKAETHWVAFMKDDGSKK